MSAARRAWAFDRLRAAAIVVAIVTTLAIALAASGCEGTETGNPDLSTGGGGGAPPLGGNPSDAGILPEADAGSSPGDAGDPDAHQDAGPVGNLDGGVWDMDGGFEDLDAGTP